MNNACKALLFAALTLCGPALASRNDASLPAARPTHFAQAQTQKDEPLVSSDLKGNEYSSIFSAMDTLVLGNMVKVVAWYDNEWGYACRVADLADMIAKKL